jgi:hypothetical protein
MIERMKELKMKEDKNGKNIAEQADIEKAMADFVKEEEDRRLTLDSGVVMKRPPKTVKEALNALKEADERYERGKGYLYGAAVMAKGKIDKAKYS